MKQSTLTAIGHTHFLLAPPRIRHDRHARLTIIKVLRWFLDAQFNAKSLTAIEAEALNQMATIGMIEQGWGAFWGASE